MACDANPLQFWGKAGGDRPGEPAWHPLPYHSLDVAAAADALLSHNPRKLNVIATLLGTDPQNARRFVVCLVALHDVGKFSVHFQAKCQEAWEQSVRPFLGEWQNPPPSNHSKDGYTMRELLSLRQLMQPATEEWCPTDFNGLWAAISGHHGKPTNDDGLSVTSGVTRPCADAALAFCREVRALFDPLVRIPQPSERNLAVLSWLLCGLTVIADWIGSNRERGWFPYCSPTISIPDYWAKAHRKAENAVREAGLIPSKLSTDLTAERLLPEIAKTLSPLQQCVSDLDLPEGPLLAIIEDVTGSGKTEAALLLAARLLEQGRASGLYFALPTMATANAMHARLERGYRRLYAEDAVPSLVLAHGKRMLNEAFSDSILETNAAAEGYEDGGGASCASWIADDRRKAFLAEVGVGTIDQALLAVLPSRHQALRLWGLSDRALIVDEAHAYDAYTGRELEALLSFQAALGGSAIVLSATLPRKQHHSLAQAFASGLGARSKAETSDSYPQLTIVSASQSVAQEIRSRADRTRELPVRRIASAAEAADEIERAAERGGAAAWIRNAVDDAIDAVAELKARGLSPVLLHARFAMGDRLDIEARVRATLGPKDETGKRPGFVIVGTQILEQSLDYDVDAMITDLAPIDLLIQRAGRLWRHSTRIERPLQNPELLVLSPDPDDVRDRDWYRTISSRPATVYSHHGIVWRSARELFAAGAIVTPGGVRTLIERVYGNDDLDDIPEPLRKASQDAMGDLSAARTFANANLLDLYKGYGGCANLWTADTITPTRLVEAVTVFRLGTIEGATVQPWYQDENPARAWALSEVSIARRKADGVPQSEPGSATAAAIKRAKEQWPEWERDLPLIVLEPESDGTWRGLVTADSEERVVRYDREFGLRIVPS